MSNPILDFFKSVLAFFEREAPLATAIMSVIPGLQLPAAALAALNAVPALCQAAEKLIGDGNGAVKFDMVSTMTQVMITTLQKMYPDIDKSKWAQAVALIPQAIETTISNVKVAQIQAQTTPPATA